MANLLNPIVKKDSISEIPVIELSKIVKTYGSTRAVDEMSIIINPGEVVGLVGANGAGKSTLMKIIAGVTKPDSGFYKFGGKEIDLKSYSTAVARELGIRVVYQELSLCTNLKVYENFYIEQYHRINGRNWHKQAREISRKALDIVFPGNNIDCNVTVDMLTIAQRQMVDIARAAVDPALKLLILDEPTSSLGSEQTSQLQNFIQDAKKKGIAFVFISHRLNEVLELSDRIYVMQNGRLCWTGLASDINETELVQKMGSAASGLFSSKNIECKKKIVKPQDKSPKVVITDLNTEQLHNINLKFCAGEIIGIAGLEGSGQRQLLHALYQAERKKNNNIRIDGRMAYVSGDRIKEGIFQHWSIKKNASITKLMHYDKPLVIDNKKESQWVSEWFNRLKIKAPDINTPLIGLSGGNQQKVLIARALLSNADIILLDDPTRGVDVETKQQLYSLFREVANEGKVIIWYSSEDEELLQCDKVYVMNSGYVVQELQGEITKEQIIDASFRSIEQTKSISKQVVTQNRFSKYFALLRGQRTIMSLIAMFFIFIIMGIVHPSAVSIFGLTLLIDSSIPLILSTISQMFIIAASDIDLGIGAYIGFINVISATIFVKKPILGLLIMLGGILAYSAEGVLVQLRKIPSIIVTLGSSFVWFGTAITILERPGGSSPQWLTNFFNISVPIIPEPIILAVVFGVIAYLILIHSPYGTVLRGFGNNPQAVVRCGWSQLKARVSLYTLAGIFGTLAGISLTGITTAADANAAQSYTLLTVAAVVMGGGELVGGIVEPFGVVFGAVTLSMIGALLGFLNVSSTYQSAVQGGILFAILAIRLAMRRREQ